MAIIQTDAENTQQQVSPEVSTNIVDPVNSESNVEVGDQTTQTTNLGGIATPTIVNQTVPIVVFVGPPSSGKSMILVRLAKFLRSQGYTVKTDPTFLNTIQYQKDCKEFERCLTTTTALQGTVKFLLVNIYKDGEEVAKLLEAPGEDFYTTDPAKTRAGKNDMIEPYLQAIMASRNIKSYVMLLDLDSDTSFRRDGSHRESYEQRILNHFYDNINKNRDRVVLLYNKIDETPFGDINGCSNPSGARKDARMYYPAWFSSMRITKWGMFTVDNFTFKTFCTGMFAVQTDDFGNKYKTYTIADDKYPRELWKEIISKW